MRAPVDQLARFDADVVAVHLFLSQSARAAMAARAARACGACSVQAPSELAEPRGQLAPRALFNSVYARFRREQN